MTSRPRPSQNPDAIAEPVQNLETEHTQLLRLKNPLRNPSLPEPSLAEAAVLHAPAPGGISRDRNVHRAAHWDILVCAALCTLGVGLGLLALLGELSFHIAVPVRGFAIVVSTICIGALLGFWIPRQVIRGRITQVSQRKSRGFVDGNAAGDGRLEFAASLTGGIIIAFALTWGALCGEVLLAEQYRGFLTRTFSHPAWFTEVLLLGPAIVVLLAVGMVGAILLIALHGWYRLVTHSERSPSRLWMAVFVGLGGAGLAATWVSYADTLIGVGLVALFLAGAIAVLRRSSARAVAPPQAVQGQLTWNELSLLVSAGLATVLAGSIHFSEMSAAVYSSSYVADSLLVWAISGGLGLLVGRLIARIMPMDNLDPLLFMSGVIALSFPFDSLFSNAGVASITRMIAVCGCSFAVIAFVGRRIAEFRRSVQCSLAWVGRSAACSLGLSLVIFSIGMSRWNAVEMTQAVSVFAVVCTGLMLLSTDRFGIRTRVSGMVLIGFWFVLWMSISDETRVNTMDDQHMTRSTEIAWHDAVRELVTADEFRTEYLRPVPPGMDSAASWRFDLSGPALDLVIIEAAAENQKLEEYGDDWAARLLGRVAARLASGGRLLVELPTPAGMERALAGFNPDTSKPAWSGYQLIVHGEFGRDDALVFGYDIPALIERNLRGSEDRIELQSWPCVRGENAPR